MINEIKSLITKLQPAHQNNGKIVKLFENGMTSTLKSIIKKDDGSYFILTGDIAAMWLRDSAAQVRPLLYVANKDEEIKNTVKGIILKQTEQILIDPYANAFNIEPSGLGHHDDTTEMSPWLWERKFEIDSLCYPIELAYFYYKETNDSSIFTHDFLKAIKEIVNVFEIEQDHENKSKYRFVRTNPGIMSVQERHKYETLARDGLGTPVKPCGLIWCGFRPSDDACQYGYLIPSNMFAVVVMNYFVEILNEFYPGNDDLVKRVLKLQKTVDEAIKKHAIINHPKFGKVYAYEVDGYGNYLLMDDANVPSLLSAPYLGYLKKDDPIYLNTRKLILSHENPFYFEGKFAKGIGSPHTPDNHIWHISLAVQGLTSTSKAEKEQILNYLITTNAGTNLMHEGFDVDDPSKYSREWFSWANSMFAIFLLNFNGLKLVADYV